MKKMMNKKTLAIFIAGAALLALPLIASAQATNKLVVQDSGQNDVFAVQSSGKTTVAGSIQSTGNDAVALVVNTELVAGQEFDIVKGMELFPSVNANGFSLGGLRAMDISADINTWTRLRFANTNTGTSAQAGIQMDNDAGQALITFYGSNYSAATLQNVIYYKNAVGGMKFVGAPGSDVGFGIGTTAASATALTVDSSNNVGMSSLAGSGNAYACVNAAGVLFRSTTPCL